MYAKVLKPREHALNSFKQLIASAVLIIPSRLLKDSLDVAGSRLFQVDILDNTVLVLINY